MNRNRLATIWDRFGTLCILVIIVVLFSALSPTIFTKPDNIVQIFVQSAITILVAVGEFFAILIAGIDLSVGSILALTGMITGKLMVGGVHPFFAVLIRRYIRWRRAWRHQRPAGEFYRAPSVYYHSGNECDISRCDLDHFRRESGFWLPV